MQPQRLIVRSDVSTRQTDRLPTQCTDQTRLENNQENASQLRTELYLHNSYNDQCSTTAFLSFLLSVLFISHRLLVFLCFHILYILVMPFVCLSVFGVPLPSCLCLLWLSLLTLTLTESDSGPQMCFSASLPALSLSHSNTFPPNPSFIWVTHYPFI